MKLIKDILLIYGYLICNIYIIQWAKSIGYVKFYYGRYMLNSSGAYSDAWDFNPAKTTTYQADGNSGYPRLGVVFRNSSIEPIDNDFYYTSGSNGFSPPSEDSTRDMQFRHLLGTINYFGLLNRNLARS